MILNSTNVIAVYRDRADHSLLEKSRNEVEDAHGEAREKESVIDTETKHRGDKSREKSAELQSKMPNIF